MRGTQRPDRTRQPAVSMQVHDLGHVRIVIHAKLRRRRGLAGFLIDEAVREVQIERVAVALDDIQAQIQPVVERER